ncbi:unnamed protein product [Parnassius apollo]|uniref:(apollo) hypothetical protein n=1 Tax=Parnassius apollo TaxID=110799 RepID=A0A8S3X9L5_PARAO|nr:unnamed protein product [Parnassius apollo]
MSDSPQPRNEGTRPGQIYLGVSQTKTQRAPLRIASHQTTIAETQCYRTQQASIRLSSGLHHLKVPHTSQQTSPPAYLHRPEPQECVKSGAAHPQIHHKTQYRKKQ